MKTSEPEPLWREIVGDTEPWRRGRLFLIIFAALTILIHALLLANLILRGAIEALLISGIAVAVFWFQFYFIWIGVHWVRWLSGALNALYGFYLFFWGIGWSSGILIWSGVYMFVVGVYLGFAPSVHFFAQRQRETKRWGEAVLVGAIFFLLLLSLGAGVLGLLGLKAQLAGRARSFANEAFQRVFAQNDTYFTLDRTTQESLKTNGRDRLNWFLQDTAIRVGTVREIKPADGELQFRYLFPFTLVTEGYMIAEGVGQKGRIQLHMRINNFEGDWRMEDLAWVYPDPVRKEQRR